MFDTSIPASTKPIGLVPSPVQPINERLVPLNGVREDCLFVQTNQPTDILYVREMVMNLLVLAASKLPDGMKLRVKKGWSSERPFYSGGVVEVCLVNEQGERLDMGDELPLRVYEERADVLSAEETAYLRHRRLLFHCMDAVGFVSKSNVWWHFEFGTPYWGAVKEKPAFYGEITPE